MTREELIKLALDCGMGIEIHHISEPAPKKRLSVPEYVLVEFAERLLDRAYKDARILRRVGMIDGHAVVRHGDVMAIFTQATNG